MSADRRLRKLEGSLPPRQAVLHWLADVHEHGSLDAYLAWLLDERRPSPLVALIERVATAARASHSREPRPMVREAERRAVMDTVFLVLLVLESEHSASEVIRIGTLRLEVLRWQLRARMADGVSDRQGWATWRSAVLDLATDLARTEAVRRILAEHYVDGREVLFPGTLAVWRELREGLMALVESMATLPGGRRRRRSDIAAIAAAAEQAAPEAASRLIERVRARTLDLLGDHASASASIEKALRGGA